MKGSLLQRTCRRLKEKSSRSENVSGFNVLWLENNATGFPVLVGISDELDWTSSFLVQSDKLTIVLHLLLAPIGTVVRPAEHIVVRRLSPIPGRRGAFRCVIG